MHRSYYENSSGLSSRRQHPIYDDYEERSAYDHQNLNHRSSNSSQSPSRDEFDFSDPEVILRLKWMDNSPRMSRLREHRQKRLINKLEQFELWDIEQEQKQKQYELAREQRYKNIVERLKSQEFCVNVMKKRHESDLETTRELETYSNDHIYFDALDDPKTQYRGPVSQYRKFQAEMDDKLKVLQHDLDNLNPRFRIQQAILPRLERTREKYSVEPDQFTKNGRRILKKPIQKDDDLLIPVSNTSFGGSSRYNYATQSLGRSRKTRDLFSEEPERPRIKPIIQEEPSVRSLSKLKISSSSGQDRKSVNFNDEIKYSNGLSGKQ